MRARYYPVIVRYVTWITTPMAVAMILFAPAFINGLYGDAWAHGNRPNPAARRLRLHPVDRGEHGQRLSTRWASPSG